MANTRHVALLKKGVRVWNLWEIRHQRVRVNLSKANLREWNLQSVDLRGADLSAADLVFANLISSELVAADLHEVNLRRAQLQLADLRRANLIGANLHAADRREANLTGADLSGAELSHTVLGDTNLKDVHGLDTCRHTGPSTIDHRTLAKSASLPFQFLRGCGLPDQFIDYLPSLFNQSIQFYSCFISYSTKDQSFAERLHADLQDKGVRCWFAPHDIKGGRKLHDQIDEAVRLYDRLLLILSEHSMNSEWVKTEMAHARQKELIER